MSETKTEKRIELGRLTVFCGYDEKEIRIVMSRNLCGVPHWECDRLSPVIIDALDIGTNDFNVVLEGIRNIYKDDMFVFMFPEAYLHPKKQRLFARFCAKIANSGIQVVVATHSDYFVKELNTLIMLDFDERSRKMGTDNGYSEDEFMKASDVKLYEVESYCDAVERTVSQDVGVSVESFDKEIKDMGVFQREILYR